MTDSGPAKPSSNSTVASEPPPRRSRLDVGEAAAIFVGVCALGVSLYTALLQKAQVSAQVYPQLTLNLNLNADGIRVAVQNKGVGPAKVRSIEVVSPDGGNVRTFREWLTQLKPSSHSDAGENSRQDISAEMPDIVAAGEEVTFLSLKSVSSEDVSPVARRARGYQISVCYCSVLNECWRVRDDSELTDDAEEVSSCPKLAVPFVGIDTTKLRDTEYW